MVRKVSAGTMTPIHTSAWRARMRTVVAPALAHLQVRQMVGARKAAQRMLVGRAMVRKGSVATTTPANTSARQARIGTVAVRVLPPAHSQAVVGTAQLTPLL